MPKSTALYVAGITQHFGAAPGATTEIIVIGIVATLVTDIWQRLLQAIAGLPPAQWGLIGRWVAGFPRGVFVHRSITTAASVRGEAPVGWAFHYAVGIAWAAFYVAIMKLGLRSGPTLISALAVSLALLVAPWFVMQPALGLGFMAARTPKPAAVRAVNVSVHTVFGVGLYLGAIGWAWLVGVA